MIHFYSNSSLNHLRSFCLSFLLLALFFTLFNFLVTTPTSRKKFSTTEFSFIENSTRTFSSFPILTLNFTDVQHRRYYCSERVLHYRPYRKKFSFKTIRLFQPNRKTSFESNSIPYNYDHWQSTPLMPRLVTICEHKLMMELLKRFDQLTRKYSLEYMMADGTLLGSWRHHDLIPWDDDIDLLMSVQLKDRLNEAIQLETKSSEYFVEFYHRWDEPKSFEYYKFYFSISPRFSEYPWRYPFVDLIFYHENETHIWPESQRNSSSILKKSVFPLRYRPLGSLWLPSPRSPPEYFQSVGWKTFSNDCINGPWSHKYERGRDLDEDYFQSKSTINCEELENIYPFVQRSSNNQEEKLIINGTVKQSIRMIDDDESIKKYE